LESEQWVTFEVSSCGHKRRIKSYKVTLGSVQRIQIGWKYRSTVQFNGGGNILGVGDVGNTAFIDLSTACYLADSTSTSIYDLEHNKGTIVRSKDFWE
jgi:hypothetical protein